MRPCLAFALLVAGCARAGEAPAADAGPPKPHVEISEVMGAAIDRVHDDDGKPRDWIEILNAGATPVDLRNHKLVVEGRETKRWTFPKSLPLGPGERTLVLAAGSPTVVSKFAVADFKLGAQDRRIELRDASGAIVDQLELKGPRTDLSVGRSKDGVGFMVPSPGEPNGPLLREGLGEVRWSHSSGLYATPFTLSSNGPETIRYTLDGSIPSTSSAVYQGPIPIAGSSVVVASAFSEGYVPSNPVSATFVFPGELGPKGSSTSDERRSESSFEMKTVRDAEKALATLPRVFVTARDASVFGGGGILSRPRGEKLEVQGFLEIQTSTQTFSSRVGVASRGDAGPKRSLEIRFDGKFGEPGKVVPLFGVREVIPRVALRASNCASLADGSAPPAYIQDALVRGAQRKVSGYGARGEFVHVFLNATYWGMYELVEIPDAEMDGANRGIQESLWSVNHKIESTKLPAGREAEFLELVKKVEQGDSEATHSFDLEAFADYLILSWYFGVGDWLINNWYAIGSPPKVPLRFYVWDAEHALANPDPVTGDPEPASSASAWVHPAFLPGTKDAQRYGQTSLVRLFHGLWKSEEFQRIFESRWKSSAERGLSETLLAERIRELDARISAAVELEAARWGDAGKKTRTTRDYERAISQLLKALKGNDARMRLALEKAGLVR